MLEVPSGADRSSTAKRCVAGIAESDVRTLLLPRIRQWCEAHADRVHAAWLPTPPVEHLQAFIVTRSWRYDFELSSDVADLEMDLFQADWPCEVLQVPNAPNATLRSFFDPQQSILIYGNAAGTSAEG